MLLVVGVWSSSSHFDGLRIEWKCQMGVIESRYESHLSRRHRLMTRASTPRWLCWQLLDPVTGEVEWLAVTQPFARAIVDRTKVWTMLPDKGYFIANWEVTADHALDVGDRRWVHDQIMMEELKDLAPGVRRPTDDDLNRIVRPERALTLDQIDRIPIAKILGKRVADRVDAAFG